MAHCGVRGGVRDQDIRARAPHGAAVPGRPEGGLFGRPTDYPFRLMHGLSRQMDRLWGEVMRGTPMARLPQMMPRMLDIGVRQVDAEGAVRGYRARGGLGLGLTIVRNFVRLHGGAVTVASGGDNAGSTFTVRLPLATAAAVEEATQDQVQSSGGLRVLVVDDNRDAADSATDVLRLLGNVVETAYDGLGGVAAARRFRPDMVFLDLARPGLDGYEARKRFVEAGFQDCYFVAMTGFGNSDDKRRTREAGFDAHLTKPVELDVLVTLLNEAQGRSPRLNPLQ